jgi:hypothetical protein
MSERVLEATKESKNKGSKHEILRNMVSVCYCMKGKKSSIDESTERFIIHRLIGYYSYRHWCHAGFLNHFSNRPHFRTRSIYTGDLISEVEVR